MKKLPFLLPCFLFATLCTAAPLTDADKRADEPKNHLPTLENLCEFAWHALNIPYEFSEEPYLEVVMFDIDHDGVPEALVTYKIWDCSGSGMNVWDWCGLRFKDGEWHFQFGDDSFGSSWDGFHVLTEEGKKPKLIASWNSYGNDGDGRHFNRHASRVTIDDEGRFKSLPFPEFEFTSKTYYDDDKEDDEIPALKLKSPNDKLEPVPEGTVHHFLPLGKTVVFEHDESKHPKSAFVKDYVWQEPVKAFAEAANARNWFTSAMRDAINPTWDNSNPQTLDEVIALIRGLEKQIQN